MCSVEQLCRWLPSVSSSQASEALGKVYFSFGNTEHLTTEVTAGYKAMHHTDFPALLSSAAANRQRQFRFFLKLFILVPFLPPLPTLHYS